TSGGSGAAGREQTGVPSNSREKTAAPLGSSEIPPSDEPDSVSGRATEPPVTPPRHSPARMQSELPRRVALEEPAPSRPTNASYTGATGHGSTASGPTTDLPPSVIPPSDAAAVMSTTPPRARGDEPKSDVSPELAPSSLARDLPKLEIPASVGPGDAVRAFARVVRARYSGALAFEDATGIRRVVFRDGDFVTAASGADGESLVAFLTQRGDLPSDVAARIGRKLPQFGRHAGAALIAQGHLRQDDLWPVLRAHAEWLVGRIVLMTSGAVGLEADVPVRMQAEPAVFGGATGAEVLVEIVRRAVSPEEALQRLGGAATALQKGQNPTLLSECAIIDAEADVVRSINDETVSDILRRVGHKDFAAVLYVLVELSVLGVASGERRQAREPRQKTATLPDHLDHAALRARILARKALSEEGDYFALLGVSRSATSYDIRRAYTTLKDEYDPSRILTSDTVDLRDEVELILEVLAEAFEILEDDLRRERYRRALDASP
ncbi:MAG TPA: DnaJ domain-containing protein, partial [Polyangiaceae bacterium]